MGCLFLLNLEGYWRGAYSRGGGLFKNSRSKGGLIREGAYLKGGLNRIITVFLTTLPTLKACNSPYFKQSFVLHSLEVIFSFLMKK